VTVISGFVSLFIGGEKSEGKTSGVEMSGFHDNYVCVSETFESGRDTCLHQIRIF